MKIFKNTFALLILLLICLAVYSAGAEPVKTNIPPAEVPERNDIGNVNYDDPTVTQGMIALAKWDLAAADRVAEQLENEDKWDNADALLFMSKLAFFHGDYIRCQSFLDALRKKTKVADNQNFYERVSKLAKIMAGAKSYESAHFVLRAIPDPDAVVVTDVLATLERAYDALTADLEIKPTSKVVVEIFPNFEGFSYATGLNEKDIETTATIAVCKFSRLMIVTPRVLLRGYSYRDTASHELVHYLIFLRAAYNCPIWLHEGIAKYEERRWDMPEGGYLEPVAQSLLAAALREDKLIPFDDMEPSFALLPSAKAGQLAFAQVCMCVKYMVQRGGFKLVLRMLNRLSRDKDWRKAIQAEMGEPASVFLKKWKDYMRAAGLTEIKGIDLVGVKLRKSGQSDEDAEQESAAETKKDKAVSQYLRLGDLLKWQGRMKAATIEYRKALNIQPNSALIINKVVYVLMAQGNFDEALPLLHKAEQLYPDTFPATYKHLGTIYSAKGDFKKAQYYFEKSSDINPFDPEVQRALLNIYSKLNLTEQRKEAERKLAILSPNRPK